ncbi:MAG: ATP-binding protein, partial [Sphaerochaeta sp.]|nr:ATP-binding protein [Sphaerochaeta sp.]
RIYAQAFGGELYHYQDYENNEIDAVIEMPDGSWSAFEIKLGANQIDASAQSLLKIQAKFLKPASSLCVICGLSNAAYRRPDGVYVVPLTALRP